MFHHAALFVYNRQLVGSIEIVPAARASYSLFLRLDDANRCSVDEGGKRIRKLVRFANSLVAYPGDFTFIAREPIASRSVAQPDRLALRVDGEAHDSRRVRYPWAMAPTINTTKLVATAIATFVSTDKFIIFPSIMAATSMTVFEFPF